jgi:hypothetical protein
MEKETECENCGMYVYFTYKIKDVKSDKLLTVCKMCVLDIRNRNLNLEGKSKETAIQGEIERLKATEQRQVIREEAEKKLYGKVKENKREAISEKDKEIIKESISENLSEDIINNNKFEELKFKELANKIGCIIKSLTTFEIRDIISKGKIEKDNESITRDHIYIEKQFKESVLEDSKYIFLTSSECGIRFDKTSNENILNLY